MNQFSIRDIEHLCGIKAHTLRMWEQRYGLVTPDRKSGNHRIYYNEELKDLLRIAFLYHNGYRVSQLARMTREQLGQAVHATPITPCNYQGFIAQLLEACIDFDQERFEGLIHCMILRVGIDKSITGLFYPFLQRIGMLWLTNHVIPAQEHFSSFLIQKKIILALDGLDPALPGPYRVLIFGPRGEYHEIPLLVAQYFFRKHRVPSTYFGVNTDQAALDDYLAHHPVSHLYLHVITKAGADRLNGQIRDLCQRYPDKQVLISGPAVSCLRTRPVNLHYLQTTDELVAFAGRLAAGEATGA
ncbi:MAG TPA: MerR family transcriptional regulator [Chitinophagaceae bacterium]|nr:MerR family transcriptional regulator [Chitinophagaceae bacterium]